jgi:hypothetical protein
MSHCCVCDENIVKVSRWHLSYNWPVHQRKSLSIPRTQEMSSCWHETRFLSKLRSSYAVRVKFHRNFELLLYRRNFLLCVCSLHIKRFQIAWHVSKWRSIWSIDVCGSKTSHRKFLGNLCTIANLCGAFVFCNQNDLSRRFLRQNIS